MKLHRHQDADEAMLKGPNFELDACTRFLGPIGSANLLVIRAQVDMVAGRLVLYNDEAYAHACCFASQMIMVLLVSN